MSRYAVVRLLLSKRVCFFLSLCICMLLLLGSVPAFAQSAQVSGTIKDPDQSVVANAAVTLRNSQTGLTLQTSTDQTGQYSFASVLPGNYQLEINKAGFAPIVISSLTVADGQNVTRDGSFSLAAASTSVTVNGDTSGTPASGYYVGNVDQGVMGNVPIVNQPYTITVMPGDEIANTQVKNFRDAMKYLPLVSFTEQQGPEILRPATRGIQGSIAQNTRMDGMAMAITGANPMEQYQALQVEQGLGAAMYGPANPSGMFDFVLKRPTEERTANLYLEQNSRSVGTVYGDAGGRMGPHKIFGYRTNLLYGDGTQFVEASRLRRRLAEFAFDLEPTDRTTIDAHYSVYDLVQRGYPGWFVYGPPKAINGVVQPTLLLPSAPDPTRVGYGQAYAGVNLTTQSTSARLLHDFSPNWHAMAGGLAQRLDRFIDTPVNTITDNLGNYSSSLATGFAPRFGIESDLGYNYRSDPEVGHQAGRRRRQRGLSLQSVRLHNTDRRQRIYRNGQYSEPEGVCTSRCRPSAEPWTVSVCGGAPARLQPRRPYQLPQPLSRASRRQPGLDRCGQQLRNCANQRVQQERNQPFCQRDVQANLGDNRLCDLCQQFAAR
jgi:iron complex outermembrane recepter protein